MFVELVRAHGVVALQRHARDSARCFFVCASECRSDGTAQSSRYEQFVSELIVSSEVLATSLAAARFCGVSVVRSVITSSFIGALLLPSFGDRHCPMWPPSQRGNVDTKDVPERMRPDHLQYLRGRNGFATRIAAPAACTSHPPRVRRTPGAGPRTIRGGDQSSRRGLRRSTDPENLGCRWIGGWSRSLRTTALNLSGCVRPQRPSAPRPRPRPASGR